MCKAKESRGFSTSFALAGLRRSTVRKRAQIVALTLKEPEEGLAQWTTREMARKTGVSHMTVRRIWKAHDLKRHHLESFEFITDPQAEEKIHDAVGLYLTPPTNALVLSFDEKTRIQALENMLEGWFGILTRKSTRRAPFNIVRALVGHIDECLKHWNESPTPFVWTKDPADIIEKTLHRAH